MVKRRVQDSEHQTLEFDRAAIFFNTKVASKFVSEHLDDEITSIDLILQSESSENTRERRTSPRKKRDLSLVLTRVRDGKTLRAKCEDSSLTGLGIEVFVSDFKVGDQIQIEFESSTASRSFFATAIVRSQRSKTTKSLLGLEITAITSRAKEQLQLLVAA